MNTDAYEHTNTDVDSHTNINIVIDSVVVETLLELVALLLLHWFVDVK